MHYDQIMIHLNSMIHWKHLMNDTLTNRMMMVIHYRLYNGNFVDDAIDSVDDALDVVY